MAVEHINELVNSDDLVQVRTKGIGFTDQEMEAVESDPRLAIL